MKQKYAFLLYRVQINATIVSNRFAFGCWAVTKAGWGRMLP